MTAQGAIIDYNGFTTKAFGQLINPATASQLITVRNTGNLDAVVSFATTSTPADVFTVDTAQASMTAGTNAPVNAIFTPPVGSLDRHRDVLRDHDNGPLQPAPGPGHALGLEQVNRPRNRRALAAALAATAAATSLLLGSTTEARADLPRAHLRGGLSHAVGSPQSDDFGFGGAGELSGELPLVSILSIEARAGAILLTPSDVPAGQPARSLGTIELLANRTDAPAPRRRSARRAVGRRRRRPRVQRLGGPLRRRRRARVGLRARQRTVRRRTVPRLHPRARAGLGEELGGRRPHPLGRRRRLLRQGRAAEARPGRGAARAGAGRRRRRW